MSRTTAMPNSLKRSAGPSPGSCRSRGGPEPGKLQQLRRAVDAAGDDDLAARPCGLWPTRCMVFDPDGAAALEQDAGGVRIGCDGQVLTAARLAQISPRRTPASPVGGRRLVIADNLLPGAIEVRVGRDAGLDRGLDHRIPERRARRVRAG